MQPYLDQWSYFKDEERYLLGLLHRYALKRRAKGLDRPWGDALGRMDPVELSAWFDGLGSEVLGATSLEGSLTALRLRIDQRVEATRAVGLDLPPDALGGRMGLDPCERAVVQALGVCQFNPELGEMLSAVAGTRFRPWPRAGALAEILGFSSDQRRGLLRALGPEGRLARARVVVAGPGPEGWPLDTPVPVEHRAVVLAQRAVDFLAGRRDALDERLVPFCVAARAQDPAAQPLGAEVRELLASLLPEQDEGRAALPKQALWFIGPRGSGVSPMAGQVAELLGLGVLRLRVEAWLHAPKRPDAGEVLRDALLGERALLLDFCDLDDAQLMGRDMRALALELLRELEGLCAELGVPLFLMSHHALQFLRLHMSEAEPIRTDYPTPTRRAALWEEGLSRAGIPTPEAPELRRLAHTFVFAAEDIARVVRHAERLQRGRSAPVQLGEVEDLCRDDLDIRLQGLTRRIRQPAQLADLVLSEEQREGIEELIAYARFRDMLFEDWGFGAHYKSGKGVHCLFTGPPGTGKTLAASIVANALDLPLYRVELSQVVDRYVGETEKRLEQIFDEAARCPCALLFDEADSLFGKRTEVRSSNDRYANLEVNYLLQRMEDFEGITILTTNLETSLDQAFLRRIRFSVRFPEPDRALSRELWRKLLPQEAELDGNIDFDRLAGRFEMSGGHIKNAVLRAALKAMRDKRGVSQADLEQAAIIEYTKLGKLVPSANLKART